MDLYSETFDVDEALHKDTSGACLKQVKDALQHGESLVRREIDRGMASDEFKKAEALRKAYEAAMTAVEAAWSSFHKR